MASGVFKPCCVSVFEPLQVSDRLSAQQAGMTSPGRPPSAPLQRLGTGSAYLNTETAGTV